MKRFKTLYIIEHTDYFFGTLYVCPVTRRSTLRYFKVLEGVVIELGDDDPYDNYRFGIEAVVEKAKEICDKNNFVLWVY